MNRHGHGPRAEAIDTRVLRELLAELGDCGPDEVAHPHEIVTRVSRYRAALVAAGPWTVYRMVPAHRCRVPGWWARRKTRIGRDSIVECVTCGRRSRRRRWRWQRET